jgi:hypothetical protein
MTFGFVCRKGMIRHTEHLAKKCLIKEIKGYSNSRGTVRAAPCRLKHAHFKKKRKIQFLSKGGSGTLGKEKG